MCAHVRTNCQTTVACKSDAEKENMKCEWKTWIVKQRKERAQRGKKEGRQEQNEITRIHMYSTYIRIFLEGCADILKPKTKIFSRRVQEVHVKDKQGQSPSHKADFMSHVHLVNKNEEFSFNLCCCCLFDCFFSKMSCLSLLKRLQKLQQLAHCYQTSTPIS